MGQDIIPSTRSDRHRSRYDRHVLEGKTIEDIAKADRVAIETVRQSIAHIDAYRKLCTQQEMEVCQIDIILQQGNSEARALREALNATMVVETSLANGKTRRERVPDHTVRMNAMRIINSKLEALKPNGTRGGLNIQVANLQGQPQQPQSAVVIPDGPPCVDFESILRKAKASRMLTDGQESIPDAEVIDADSPEA